MVLGIKQIAEAGKHMLFWRKVYNNLCRSCQLKLVRGNSDIKQVGTEVVVDRTDLIIKEHFCQRCKDRIELMKTNYKGE